MITADHFSPPERLPHGRSTPTAARRVFKLMVLVVLTSAAVLLAPYAGAEPRDGSRPSEQAPVDSAGESAPGEFLVKFKPGTPNHVRENVVREHGGRKFRHVRGIDVEAIEVEALKGTANAAASDAVLQALRGNPNVEFVEPNYLRTIAMTPNDPLLSQQWAWDRIDAFEAWDLVQGSASTVIAIVDSGVDRTHPDLDAKIVAGYDFVEKDTEPDDGHGHGTHVAGTAAAETSNGVGIAGMCPGCSLMPVRALGNNGSGKVSDVISGIDYAVANGAKVINLSLTSAAFSESEEEAIDRAWNRGVFVACAAGNASTSKPTYPAALPSCFSVASTDPPDVRSSFSNYGSWVDVAAPGRGIYSSWIGGVYNTISGTSMATPHVAGLAGLLASQGHNNAEIGRRICETADPIVGTGSSWRCGRINALRAVSDWTPHRVYLPSIGN